MIKIFIPIYNEEKFIGPNLKEISKELSKIFNEKFIIYLVNDGSTDKTGEIIDSLKLKNAIQLRCKGPTVRENLAKMLSRHSNNEDLLLFMDSDLSTDMAAIPYLFNEVKNNFDIVIGSRYVKGSKIKRTPYRFMISKLFNFFLRFYFNSKINDHECGFKLFKAKVVKDLVNEMGWNLHRRAFWDSEMLIRAQKKGYSIKEIPVKWVEGPKTYISVKKERTMIPYILSLKFRLIKERKRK